MPTKIRSASTLIARFIEHASSSSGTGTAGSSAPNPFLPQKNPTTGRWHPPQYSLRRQKELVKQARADGVLGLLPPGLKAGREQGAGAVLGVETAAGVVPKWEGEPAPRSTAGIRSTQRRFKGHKWEREQKERAEFIAKRMETMAKRIAESKATRIQERAKARPSLPF
ncbi:54S ribosomal protein L25, mitochondrial [Ceratobasidium sp. 414]|nr:54S ribosomal protein L25, mitochondrial [Ceratobasidium sp. 414]